MRLDITDVDKKIKRLNNLFNSLNKNMKSASGNKAVERSVSNTLNITKNVSKTVIKINQDVKAWANSQKDVERSVKSSSSALGGFGSKLKGVLATYLGYLDVKYMVDSTDKITSAQNKFNYSTAQQLGSDGYNADGSYSDATLRATQATMDKMYASAQKVRVGYDDTMKNVSKLITLAPDAFQGNVDNAIRFNEIMAETYALGGASPDEMATSMYQLTQALGAGALAGDELRSVREGAPLAYKAIEEFVQGVWNTDESLKELGAQGKVTSDMVVAAIMNIGDSTDKAFAQTTQTFDQTWEQIKNAALKSFTPVGDRLRQALTNALDNGLIEKFEKIFTVVANVILKIFDWLTVAVQWCAENWNWLKHVIVGALILIASYIIMVTSVSIANAVMRIAMWVLEYGWIMVIIAAVLSLLYVFYLFASGSISACEAVEYALYIVGAAVLLIGLLLGNLPMIIIGAVLIMLGVIWKFFDKVCYGVGWVAGFIVNYVFAIVNVVVTWIYLCLTFWYNVIAVIVKLIAGLVTWIKGVYDNYHTLTANLAAGIVSVFSALGTNIKIAFQNAFNGALGAFWNFISSCLEGLDWLAEPLGAIAELFGKSFDYSAFKSGIKGKADYYKNQSQQEYVSISDAWNNGFNSNEYRDLGDAWSDGWNVMKLASFKDAIDSGMSTLDYVDPNSWGEKASNWGAGIKSKFDDLGVGARDAINDKLSNIGNSITSKLGLGDVLKSASKDPSGGSSSPYDKYKIPSNDDLLAGIKDDTGSIADSVKLSEDDLAYLRDVANMEWKKEFTTAEIHVDMTNNNSINGENDLDGLVTKLSEKLYEELDAVANGVYA